MEIVIEAWLEPHEEPINLEANEAHRVQRVFKQRVHRAPNKKTRNLANTERTPQRLLGDAPLIRAHSLHARGKTLGWIEIAACIDVVSVKERRAKLRRERTPASSGHAIANRERDERQGERTRQNRRPREPPLDDVQRRKNRREQNELRRQECRNGRKKTCPDSSRGRFKFASITGWSVF